MKKIWLLLCAVILTGCESPNILTKEQAYPGMYVESPSTILVVPASNLSTAADAPYLYSTTIAEPLAESGYYVLSVPASDAIFNMEGVTEGGQLEGFDVALAKQHFGADAVLFVTINEWDTNYYVTGGDVTVGAEFKLVSAESRELLWKYSDTVVIDTSGNSGSLLVDIISTALSTALTDYVPIARTVNYRVMTTIPAGKYHELHKKDGTMQVVREDRVTQ